MTSSGAGPTVACGGQSAWPSGAGVPVVVGRRFAPGQPIGSGGFSAVYRAADVLTATSDQVAVKVLLPQVGLDVTAVTRFLREMKLMSGLSHANVMPGPRQRDR